MNNVYVVVEYGGMYEDKWQHVVGVCSTPEIADSLKAKIESKHDPSNCIICEEEWFDMLDCLSESEESGFEYKDLISGIKALFPEYSEEDIKRAKELYDDDLDYCGVSIKQIDFYTKLSDISNNGINN